MDVTLPLNKIESNDQRMIYVKFEWNWLNSFTHECVVQSLVEIGTVVVEKKIFKFRQCISAFVFVFISYNKLQSLHPRILYLKFVWNWPNGSEDEGENKKNLRRNKDGGQRTHFNQNSSLEPSAQVTSILKKNT